MAARSTVCLALGYTSPLPDATPGAKPNLPLDTMRAGERANAAWTKTWKGEAVTASVLTSGVKADLSKRPLGELLNIDADSGKSQLIASGTIRNILVSPDQTAIAFCRRIEAYQSRRVFCCTVELSLRRDANRIQPCLPPFELWGL